MALISSKISSTRWHVFAAALALVKSEKRRAMFCCAVAVST